MSRRVRVILALVGVTALVGLGAVVAVRRILLRDTATPASIGDALARYRAAAARGTTPIPSGVYVYATRGSESVSALGGATHAYPERSTITVTETPCGMSLRWDVLKTRSTTWNVCIGSGPKATQRVDGWMERHQFFGQDDSTTWSCGDSVWRGATSRYDCHAGDTTENGTLTAEGAATIDVGGAPVGTVHLRIDQVEAGGAHGRIVEERWLERETGLPVRLRYHARSVNGSPVGDVTFTEDYDITLLSLEPRT